MEVTMIIHIVQFTSALPGDRIQALFAARAQQYTAVPACCRSTTCNATTGSTAGRTCGTAGQSMQAFRASELSRSICDVYQVTESALEVADVVLTLRPEPAVT
jgi:hypothetical protein